MSGLHRTGSVTVGAVSDVGDVVAGSEGRDALARGVDGERHPAASPFTFHCARDPPDAPRDGGFALENLQHGEAVRSLIAESTGQRRLDGSATLVVRVDCGVAEGRARSWARGELRGRRLVATTDRVSDLSAVRRRPDGHDLAPVSATEVGNDPLGFHQLVARERSHCDEPYGERESSFAQRHQGVDQALGVFDTQAVPGEDGDEGFS